AVVVGHERVALVASAGRLGFVAAVVLIVVVAVGAGIDQDAAAGQRAADPETGAVVAAVADVEVVVAAFRAALVTGLAHVAVVVVGADNVGEVDRAAEIAVVGGTLEAVSDGLVAVVAVVEMVRLLDRAVRVGVRTPIVIVVAAVGDVGVAHRAAKTAGGVVHAAADGERQAVVAAVAVVEVVVAGLDPVDVALQAD